MHPRIAQLLRDNEQGVLPALIVRKAWELEEAGPKGAYLLRAHVRRCIWPGVMELVCTVLAESTRAHPRLQRAAKHALEKHA